MAAASGAGGAQPPSALLGKAKVIFLNMFWDRRFAIYMFAYKHLSHNEARIEAQADFIAKYANDDFIVCLGEIAQERDKLSMLKIALAKRGIHSFLSYPYGNPMDKHCFHFGIVCKSSTETEIELIDHLYYTKTGRYLKKDERAAMTKDEAIDFCLGTEYEKGIGFFKVNNKFIFGVLHVGLQDIHGEKVALLLAKRCKEMVSESGLPVFLIGDSNAFDSSKADAYLQAWFEPFHKAGALFSQQFLTDEPTSFISVPFDIRWKMTKDEIRQEAEFIAAKDKDGLIKFHQAVIDRLPVPADGKKTGVDGIFEHPISKDPLASVQLD